MLITMIIIDIKIQTCTGIDEDLMDTQPFKRSIMAFRLTSPEWRVNGSPSLTHSSYFSRADTMCVKSGLFEGLAAQQRFIRCASASWQLAGKGGRSFCKITNVQSINQLYLNVKLVGTNAKYFWEIGNCDVEREPWRN